MAVSTRGTILQTTGTGTRNEGIGTTVPPVMTQTEQQQNVPTGIETTDVGNGIGVAVQSQEEGANEDSTGEEQGTVAMPVLPRETQGGGALPIDISLSSGVDADTDDIMPGSSCSSITTASAGLSTGTEQTRSTTSSGTEQQPPKNFTSNEDKELWYLQKNTKEKINKAVKSNVGKYTKLYVFKYYKFVTNSSKFLKPQPGDVMTPYWIISKQLGWSNGKERAIKWNTYAKYSLDVIKQQRSTIVSQMKKSNLQGKVCDCGYLEWQSIIRVKKRCSTYT